MTQHTPGPWLANACYVSGQTDDISIAVCSYRGKVGYVEAEANARLIAAAPEMLEALEEALDNLLADITISKASANYDAKSLVNINNQKLVERWGAIISKAKGE